MKTVAQWGAREWLDWLALDRKVPPSLRALKDCAAALEAEFFPPAPEPEEPTA